ncbi:ABC transporter ATP-binding protein [Vreelandella olivaria]|uniref:ABC transporter ATP-binding protein n=1 Tax=Vreelandella olivaria TaxID=390919 RepID=UPI00201F838B|nr:ABC transporter ATP-binding protein [Halomonas olivaria]
MNTPFTSQTLAPHSWRLQANSISLAYSNTVIVSELSVTLPDARMTVIIGPNGCGKSSLLRALAGILTPTQGQVLLDGRPLQRYTTRERARQVGLLPQVSTAPAGITVLDLISRGRFPHQGWLRQWSEEDEFAVTHALALTRLTGMEHRRVDELSGGQRQRVWLALVLAQNPCIMLMDEPTTYLDIAHQHEVLELCLQLNRSQRHTLVMVLHDLNQAARYADHIIAMKDGKIAAAGTPSEVIHPTVLAHVFDIDAHIMTDPITHTPMVVPIPTRP